MSYARERVEVVRSGAIVVIKLLECGGNEDFMVFEARRLWLCLFF